MIKRIIKKYVDNIITKIVNISLKHINDGTYVYVNYKLQLHNDYGPAIIGSSVGVEYWVNGAMHRLDGPAKESPNGSKYWFVDGNEYDTYLEYSVAAEDYRSKLNAR